MALPEQISGHLLFVSTSPHDRLALFERLIAAREGNDGLILALAPAPAVERMKALFSLSGVPDRRSTILEVNHLASGNGQPWAGICTGLDEAVQTVLEKNPERPVMLLVDLDAVFSLCNATSEMMSVVYHLSREHAAHGRTVATVVSQSSLPKGLPDEFFDVHSQWVFGRNTARHESAAMDQSAERLALTFSEFRQRYLASARDDDEMATSLLPRFLDDFRRGILIVDRSFTVRFCSQRAARLLGREVADLTDRPINTCIDGVDLVTIKHECGKLTPGNESGAPFIASWRIAPGVYEPREVAVDPLRSGHQTIGYIVSISRVEPVRGPRAVYQQLKEEKATTDPAHSEVGDDSDLNSDESISSDLHGTQITRREHEVILLTLKGMTNREISEYLKIAEVTVKKHLTSVYRKLRITNRGELISSFAGPGGKA